LRKKRLEFLKRSKIIFLIAAMIFLIIVMFFIYDFSKKTTFPGKSSEQDVPAQSREAN